MTVTLSTLAVCLAAGIIAVIRKRARREAENLRRATAWAEPIPASPVSPVDELRRLGGL